MREHGNNEAQISATSAVTNAVSDIVLTEVLVKTCEDHFLKF